MKSSVVTLALIASASANGADRCVSTTQELHDALLEAENFIGDFNIQLRSGRYTADSFEFSANLSGSHRAITLTGGWTGTSGCTHQSMDASRTILAGTSSSGALLQINSYAADNSTVSVSGLALTNPGGMCFAGSVGTSNRWLLDRLKTNDCRGTDSQYPASVHLGNNGTLVVRNLAITSGIGPGIGGMTIVTTGQTFVNHVTIAASNSYSDDQASGLSLYNAQGGIARVSNTVVWNGVDNVDLAIEGPGARLYNVVYGTKTGVPDVDISYTDPPEFAGTQDPHLTPNSYLIDSGGDVPLSWGGSGAFDADGRTRRLGAGVDIGAYEYSDQIFADGLEFQTP